ncbi:ABC transporter ATP-binding protein [candidate division KSB1 bacterium]
MIECRDLCYSFSGTDRKAVLADLTLTWRDSEYQVIYGDNGSGKSTLGLCLAGVLTPEAGGIELDGRPIRSNLEPDRPFPDLGLVFQNPDDGFFADTVERDVAFNLENLGRPPDYIAARVTEVLAELGISHLAPRALSTLSAGEKKLVALAGALASNPRFLILDEPTSLLDPHWSRMVHSLLKKLNAGGLAVMVLTCDPAELGEGESFYRLEGGVLRSGVEVGARLIIESPPPRPSADNPDPDHTILRVEELSLDRPDVEAKPLNFSLSRGEIVGLVGPNGTGKTGLLLVLAGLSPPDGGRVTFCEGDPPPGYIGLAFQDPEDSLFARTVAEELELALTGSAGVTANSAKGETVDSALEAVGLSPDDYLGRSPWTLSPGEGRRVVLAAMIVGGAELLLLDDPASSLDPAGRAALGRSLRRLADEGRAVVLTSCRPAAAGELCDRLVFMGGEGELSE